MKTERITDGVWVLRGGITHTMNVYFIEDGDGVVVFDAGEKGMAKGIIAAANKFGGINKVVLGHADLDHRGAAPALSELAPVACHPDAVAEAEGSGGRSYWRTNELRLDIRILHGLLSRFVWDGGPVKISDTVKEGDRLADFCVIELPGHAPGQIGLWRASDRVALSSDCFYLNTMWGRPTPARVPLDAYNLDTPTARESIRKLAVLEPKIVCTGHLGPLSGPNLKAELELAANR